MAMRLRRMATGWIALCAAEHPGAAGDVYLDDGQDHAIRVKLQAEPRPHSPPVPSQTPQDAR